MSRPTHLALAIAIATAAMATAIAASDQAPSIVPGMPGEVLSMRDCTLDKRQYESLADEWRTYLDRNPKCAIAEVQLGRALRYAGAPADEVVRHFAQALKLDAECPEALDAAAATYLGEWKPLADGAAGCYELGLQAVVQAPEWADPHFTLWPLALILGRSQEADVQISALLRKGGIPSPVLDYCFNMLVGAEKDAIIFTNGDNDTYGCRALQVTYGLRLDVHVINLSMISQPEIEREVFGRFGDNTPLSAPEREKMRRQFEANYTRDHEFYFVKVLKAIATRAAKREWRGPVYVALTVPGATTMCPQPLRMEGLLWRVITDPGDSTCKTAGGDAGTDVDRTRALFEHDYRFDSASDRGFDWERNNSVRALVENYQSVLFRLAVAAGEAGDRETMQMAFRRGIELASFHENSETADAMREYWISMDPGNPEAKSQATRRD